jgi:hypothetical protein
MRRGWQARRRLAALPLAAVVARIAAMETGELLARARHWRPRRVPGAEPPAAVAFLPRRPACFTLRPRERRAAASRSGTQGCGALLRSLAPVL